MIPKSHHKLYYILAEQQRNRALSYDITEKEFRFFKALKGIRKSQGSCQGLHFWFVKIKTLLDNGFMGEDTTVDDYLKACQRMNPGELDHLPGHSNLDFMYKNHAWDGAYKNKEKVYV